jgi:hypothetical protein
MDSISKKVFQKIDNIDKSSAGTYLQITYDCYVDFYKILHSATFKLLYSDYVKDDYTIYKYNIHKILPGVYKSSREDGGTQVNYFVDSVKFIEVDDDGCIVNPIPSKYTYRYIGYRQRECVGDFEDEPTGLYMKISYNRNSSKGRYGSSFELKASFQILNPNNFIDLYDDNIEVDEDGPTINCNYNYTKQYNYEDNNDRNVPFPSEFLKALGVKLREDGDKYNDYKVYHIDLINHIGKSDYKEKFKEKYKHL